jgi:hypothetical protein
MDLIRGFLFNIYLLYFGMENINLIKFGDNKIILKYPHEVLTFEPLKKPIFEVGLQFFDFKHVRYFLTKRKP